jgi:hypothetical protein
MNPELAFVEAPRRKQAHMCASLNAAHVDVLPCINMPKRIQSEIQTAD